MKPLRIAMVGYGFMGRAHSNAWRQVSAFFDVPETQMAVIVGRDETAVAQAGRQLGWAESATDWREVVTRPDIDIVDICSPGFLHADIAVAALAAGKHVLVEKPLANSLPEAVAMATAAKASNTVAMVGFNYRHVPALRLAKRLIESGRLGPIRQLRASYLQDWLADPSAAMSWRLRKDSAGSGALGDLASHVVDQLLALTGDQVTGVNGRLATITAERPGPAGPEPVTVDDAAWAWLSFAGGAQASIEVSRVATGRKNALTIEVYGERGALQFDLERLNELRFLDVSDDIESQGFRTILVTEPEHPDVGSWWPQGHILGWEHSFVHQMRDLLLAIGAAETGTKAQSGSAPIVPSFDDGLAVQRVLDAIERSAAAGGGMVELAPTVDARMSHEPAIQE